MDTAKVFWNGRSQAVRLPKEYRLDATEVRVRKHGNAVILEPLPDDWQWLERIAGPIDDDFSKAVAEKLPMPENDDLDFFG